MTGGLVRAFDSATIASRLREKRRGFEKLGWGRGPRRSLMWRYWDVRGLSRLNVLAVVVVAARQYELKTVNVVHLFLIEASDAHCNETRAAHDGG